jgi:hypothetical protein
MVDVLGGCLFRPFPERMGIIFATWAGMRYGKRRERERWVDGFAGRS